MDILTVDYNDDHAGYNFVKSLHNTGFAVIKNTPIRYDMVESIFNEWQDFFNSDNKYKYSYNKTKGDGYVGMEQSEKAKNSAVIDYKEFYQIYIPWGRYPKGLSDKALIYYTKAFNLAVTLLTWLDNFSPSEVKKTFSENLVTMASLERTMLRVLHYPPLVQNNTETVRAGAHEDINLLTLLPASNATGLQVKTKDGQWLDIGTNSGEVIVNVGDMLQECSSKYYISTTHRVVNPNNQIANKSRLSLPLFIHPRADVYLSKQYPRAEQYLNERLEEIGLL